MEILTKNNGTNNMILVEVDLKEIQNTYYKIKMEGDWLSLVCMIFIDK